MTRKTNEERLGLPSTGAKDTVDASAAAVAAPSGGGLSFVSPTAMVSLREGAAIEINLLSTKTKSE